MKRKALLLTVFALALLSVAFLAGRHVGRVEGGLRTVAYFQAMVPDWLRAEVSQMSQSDREVFLKRLDAAREDVVVELSLLDLFQVMGLLRVEAARREGGEAAEEESVRYQYQTFLTAYESGSVDYSGWKPLADSLAEKVRQRLKEMGAEPVATANPDRAR